MTATRKTAAAAVLLLAACGRVPESTEKARGVLSGVNVVLALSVLFVVLALLFAAGAVALDRFIRTRRALAEAPPTPPEPDEPEEEVVAGIGVGRAPVPRWLYGAYLLIPLFAFAYVFSNVRPPAEAERPTQTETPQGPVREAEIAAEQIEFTKDVLNFVAATEVTVTFNNTDAAPHDFTVWETEQDATAGGDPIATTGTLNAGATGDVTFETPEAGTWYFNCTIHPATMQGDIEVSTG